MAQATLLSYFQKDSSRANAPLVQQQLRPSPRPRPSANGLLPHNNTQHEQTVLIPTSTELDHASASPSYQNSPNSPGRQLQAKPPKQDQATASASAKSTSQSVATDQSSPFLIASIRAEHIPSLTNLTTSILPVRYTSKFYTETISQPDSAAFSRTILYLNQPIGWIACRVQPLATASAQQTQIYISTLCILAPFRERGLASQLLKAIIQQQPQQLEQYKVSAIYAHVWEANEEALEWYEHRGFRKVELVGEYYKRLKPRGAWIVRRELGGGGLFGTGDDWWWC